MNKPRFALFALVCLLAVLCLPGGALAAADTDFVSKLVSSFYDKTSAWEPILKKYALLVFRWLLILEVCFLGIKAALNREQVGDIFKHFVMLLLMAGFFLAVINNYKEWSWNLIDGLKQIGFELSSPQYSSDSPFIAGMKIVNLILSKLSAWSPGNSVALLLAALVVMVCFALISAQVVFIKCEAMIAMMAALILVSFGGSSFLKDYAVNALRYVLAVAFKLFVMQLVLGVGLAFIQDFDTSTAELQDIFIVIGASIVLLALVKSIPDTCAGIINGSHVSGRGHNRRHRRRGRGCGRGCGRLHRGGTFRRCHDAECQRRLEYSRDGRQVRHGQRRFRGPLHVGRSAGCQNGRGKSPGHSFPLGNERTS